MAEVRHRRRTGGAPGWDVHTHGGRRNSGLDAVEWARRVADLGAGEILLTSMDRDGTKSGFDLELTRAVADAVPVPVIASGGVATLDDIRYLLPLESEGVEGVIIGRAGYSGAFSFREACAVGGPTTGA